MLRSVCKLVAVVVAVVAGTGDFDSGVDRDMPVAVVVADDATASAGLSLDLW